MPMGKLIARVSAGLVATLIAKHGGLFSEGSSAFFFYYNIFFYFLNPNVSRQEKEPSPGILVTLLFLFYNTNAGD